MADINPADKYPRWLIEKVAEAIAAGVDGCHHLYDKDPVTGNEHSVMYREEIEEGAVAVLDALDFRAGTFYDLDGTVNPWWWSGGRLHPGVEHWLKVGQYEDRDG